MSEYRGMQWAYFTFDYGGKGAVIYDYPETGHLTFVHPDDIFRAIDSILDGPKDD